MEEPEEITAGGSHVIRHTEPVEPAPRVGGDNPVLEDVQGHVERHLGPVESVFGEIVSTSIHLDVLRVAPTDDRPATTLVTCGMSALPMTVPEGSGEPRFAELLLVLAPDWPLDDDSLQDERHYWPIRLLKTHARLPHEYGTWLGHGHTVPHGDPPEPFAPGIELCGAILLPALTSPDGFDRLDRDGAEPIHFFGVYAMHAPEMQFKLERGTEALLDAWDESGLNPSEIVDVERPSAVGARRRKHFGLF